MLSTTPILSPSPSKAIPKSAFSSAILFLICFKPLWFQKLDFYKRWELPGSKLLIFIMFEGSGDLKRVFLQGLELLELQKLDFLQVRCGT